MGDLISESVTTDLFYIPKSEFDFVLNSKLGKLEKAEIIAKLCRVNTLYMISKAGSGHIGSSFSSMEIMTWINLFEVEYSSGHDINCAENIFFSSKGHDAPALYNTMIAKGLLDFENIHKLRRIGGLPGHPDVLTPYIYTNTGSLGMGVSKAKGMIWANRFRNKEKLVFVLTGDGELQEGQFWESLISAANNKMHELIVIIDHNKLQSDTFVDNVSSLGDLNLKLRAFGFEVYSIDGNNISEVALTIEKCKYVKGKPKVIIANTIKGKGVTFMEHSSLDSDTEFYKFHSGAPSNDNYLLASAELIHHAKISFEKNFNVELKIEKIENKINLPSVELTKLIPAYTDVLMEVSKVRSDIIVLDADLLIDTGLLRFKEKYPSRFIECGIAEQDMVSQAGGLAISGYLPIVHSFACFLSSRPQEQIYNNSTENTKIIYVGSLAGILPAGPGHSHQSVRDISVMTSIPNLIIVEPSCIEDLNLLFKWAINENNASCYFRIESIPFENSIKIPSRVQLKLGHGISIYNPKKASKNLIIAYGPLFLNIALSVAKKLYEESNIKIEVINHPWLNYVDNVWFKKCSNNVDNIFIIDNNYKNGSLGQLFEAKISECQIEKVKIFHKYVDSIPKSGSGEEVLNFHKLDESSILQFILGKLK